jgi:hypothetical protein
VNRPFRARTLIHEPRYDEQCSILIGQYPRLEAAIDGAEWAISTQPERFEQAPGTALRILVTHALPDAPQLWIYFTIETHACTLHYIVQGQVLGEVILL